MQELEKIGTLNPVELFKVGGIQQVIDSVRAEVQGIVPDTSTLKGRKEIASLAHKVAKSKTLLDKMGKSLADNLNAQLKPINAERRLARDELDKLRDEIREPLTVWEAEKEAAEAAEAARQAAEKLAAELEQAHEIGLLLNEKITRDRKEAAEAARIASEKFQAEHDERIKAQAIAEANAAAEREKADLIRREEAAKRAAIAAEENAKRAKEQAERAAIAAAEQARRAQEQAVLAAEQSAERERVVLAKRIEREKQQQQDIADAAKRDQENIARKCGEACDSIEALGVDRETARKIILAIHNGKIKNVSINYV